MFTVPVGQEFGQCPERDGLSVVTVFVASTGKSGQLGKPSGGSFTHMSCIFTGGWLGSVWVVGCVDQSICMSSPHTGLGFLRAWWHQGSQTSYMVTQVFKCSIK